MARFISCFLLILSWQLSVAQESDTVLVEELEIVDDIIPVSHIQVICRQPRLKNPIVYKGVSPQRRMSAENNLSDILTNSNTIFLRTYGLGSLSTPSSNGTNASHTAVLWNGINILSPMNGTLDFSLVPASVVDGLTLDNSGSSARYGSGAIGATIHLKNDIHFEKVKRGSVNLQGGSFDNYRFSGNGQFSNEKYYSRTNIFYHSAQNDFKYKNKDLFGEPIVQQTNAALLQYGFLQENAIKINQQQMLEAKVWHQNSHREIPPSSVQATNVAFQDDVFTRSFLHWQYVDEKVAWHVKSAYLDEYLRYNDATIGLDDTSRSQSWINQLEAFLYLPNNQKLKIGLNYSFFEAFSEGYGASHTRNQLALYGDYEWTSPNDNWTVQASIREDFVDNEFNPVVGTAEIAYQKKDWRFFGSVSRNFRLPTFNDLYWAVGGNPDLKSEIGWSEEVGMSFSQRGFQANQDVSYSFSTSIFNKNVQNMIVWTPDGGIWTPSNVAAVWSRGWSIQGNWNKALSNRRGTKNERWSFRSSARYDFTHSTNQEVSSNAQNSLGKQLIYVPKHRGHISVGVLYKTIELEYEQNLVSRRFTSTDNNRSVEGYTVGNLKLNYSGEWFQGYELYLSVNNIWNSTFEVIESRPMPRRYFQMGMTVYFQ